MSLLAVEKFTGVVIPTDAEIDTTVVELWLAWTLVLQLLKS